MKSFTRGGLSKRHRKPERKFCTETTLNYAATEEQSSMHWILQIALIWDYAALLWENTGTTNYIHGLKCQWVKD